MRWDRDYVAQAAGRNGMIAGFNVFGYEDAQAVIHAAQRADREVLLMINREASKSLELEHWAALLNSMARKAQVPVGIHLDHCSDPEMIFRAIDAGFTSVMYDGSALPLEENMANTCRICEKAHRHQVYVEAELGQVPYDELGETRIRMTSPEEAEVFSRETQSDWLAVSVGNVHRLLGRKVKIRFDVLKEIENVCRMPLVIHGASGVEQQDFPLLCASRVGKINVGTALRRVFGETLRREVKEHPEIYDRQALMKKPVAGVEETAYQIIKNQCGTPIMVRRKAL